jgi:hypothetical protein
MFLIMTTWSAPERQHGWRDKSTGRYADRGDMRWGDWLRRRDRRLLRKKAERLRSETGIPVEISVKAERREILDDLRNYEAIYRAVQTLDVESLDRLKVELAFVPQAPTIANWLRCYDTLIYENICDDCHGGIWHIKRFDEWLRRATSRAFVLIEALLRRLPEIVARPEPDGGDDLLDDRLDFHSPPASSATLHPLC